MMSRTASRLGQRGKQESGVILVLTAILMVVFLGMAALAIDVGSFYQAQRQAQAAADAGALAALNDLPTSPTLAGSDATTYAQQTFPGSSVVPTTPATTGGSATTIKVVVTASTPSFFGNIFGITSEDVSATAIAGYPQGTVPAALFAMDSTCSGDGVKINGNSITIPGGITSNGALTVSVSGSTTPFGSTTFGGPNNCPAATSGATFTSGPTPITTPFLWPLDYRVAPLKPPCGVGATFNVTSKTMSTADPPGVYCASGAITLPAGIVLNGYTLIADSFSLGGNNISVSPANNAGGLSLYETGSSLLNISGNQFTANVIFAPKAEVELSGNSNNNIMTGFIEAEDVWINGNNHQVNGTGPPSQGSAGALQG